MTDMMRKGAIGIGLAAMMLPLAGCGSKESAEDTATASGEEKSVEDVKREADKLIKPQPGAYKQTVEMVDMQIPGLPPEAAEQMKTMTAKVETHTICITDLRNARFRAGDDVDERDCHRDQLGHHGGHEHEGRPGPHGQYDHENAHDIGTYRRMRLMIRG